MPDSAQFNSLDLKPALLSNIADIGYTVMTLVQAETLPHLIGGSDVLARAKTGCASLGANRLRPILTLRAASPS